MGDAGGIYPPRTYESDKRPKSEDSEGLDVFTTIMGGLVFVALYVSIITIVRGAVLSTLWRWFIVNKFGAPELSVAEAIGLSLLVGVFTLRHNDEHQGLWQLFWMSIANSLIALGLGWIIFQFV